LPVSRRFSWKLLTEPGQGDPQLQLLVVAERAKRVSHLC